MDDYINGCTGLVDDHGNAVDVPHGGDARTAKAEPLGVTTSSGTEGTYDVAIPAPHSAIETGHINVY